MSRNQRIIDLSTRDLDTTLLKNNIDRGVNSNHRQQRYG